MSVESSPLLPFAVVPAELRPSFSYLDGIAVVFISKAKKYSRRNSFSSRVCFLTDDLLCVAHADGKVTHCCKLEDIERIVTSSKENIAGVQMRERPFRYGKNVSEQDGMFFEVPVDILLKFSSSCDYEGFVECVTQQATVCTGEPLPVASKEKREKFQRLLVLVEDGLRTRPMLPTYHTKEEVRAAQLSLHRVKPSKGLASSTSGEPSVTMALALSMSEGERAASCDASRKVLPAPTAAACSPTAPAAADHHRVSELPRSSTPDQPLPAINMPSDHVPNPLSAPSESASQSVHRASSEFFTLSIKKDETDGNSVSMDVIDPCKQEKKNKSRKVSDAKVHADSERLPFQHTSPYRCLDKDYEKEPDATDVKRVRDEGCACMP